jgi:magnesium chelatase subunit D
MCSKCSERYKKKRRLPIEEREMNVVDLPLGATEDRVVGSLDVGKAIKLGVEALEPGILAEANQNVLYVDEINLLPDHIADDLLDAAATGWNVVEREGISVGHPSRFIFVGTMNPEEGELRPQLLDRLPLSVVVDRISSVKDRIDIVKKNIEFEKSPEVFLQEYQAAQEELKKRIIQAREFLPKVRMSEVLLEVVCRACLDLKVDGMRPDIVIIKAAHTLAAFDGRVEATLEDVLVASELALSHRTREGGFLEPAGSDEIKKTFMDKTKEVGYEKKKEDETGSMSRPKIESDKKKRSRKVFFWPRKIGGKKKRSLDRRLKKTFKRWKKAIFSLDRVRGRLVGILRKHKAPEEARSLNIAGSSNRQGIAEGVPLLTKIKSSIFAPFQLFFKIKKPYRKIRSLVGKRAETVTALHRGRPCGWRFPSSKPRDIHLPATIRAAARRQKNREKPFKTALNVSLMDVREKLRLYKAPATIVFVIDLSKSMVFNIEEVKEAILKLHEDAYRYRDKVGIVALKGTRAVVVQHPITNLKVVANKLLGLGVSGFTPLAAGMFKALEVLKEAKRRDSSTIPVMVIVTDGNANVPLMRDLQTCEARSFDPLDLAFFKHEDLAIDDVMLVSKMTRKEGISTIVINTNPVIGGADTSGFIVTGIIASITNGTCHEVGRIRSKKELVRRTFEAIAQDQRQICHQYSQFHRQSTTVT